MLFSGVSTWGSCSVTCLVQGSVGIVYPVRPKEKQPQWQRPALDTCIQHPQYSGAVHLQGLEALVRDR